MNREKLKSLRLILGLFIFVFNMFVLCKITASAQLQVPDEKQLVTYYQATAQKSLFNINRWKLEVQEQTTMEGTFAKTTPQKYIRKHTVYRDGDRVDTRTQLVEVFKDETKETRFQNVIFGGRSYFYDKYIRKDEQLKWLIVNNETTITFLNCAGLQARAFAGYMLGDIKPLAGILAEKSSVLKVRPSMESVNGCSTYVLEADTIYGYYTVWMDPNSGYSPRRVVIERGAKGLLVVNPNSKEKKSQNNNEPPRVNPRLTRPKLESVTEVMDIQKIQEIGGDFFATAGTTTTTRVYSDGSVKKFNRVCEISLIDFKPNFSEIPGIFAPDVPNGTKVHDDNRPTGKFIWQDGKVISLVTESQPIVGKPLPDMKEFTKTDGTEDNKQQNNDTQTKSTVKPDESIPQKSFLNADEILAKWQSTYGSIKTMSVSYFYRLLEYKPPSNNPNEPSPIAYEYLERVEDGKRYHVRCSTAKDGFERPESLMEHAFDGKVTREYWGVTKHGTIQTGLTGRGVESLNCLKEFMLLEPMVVQGSLAEEYPNGVPRFILRFRTLKSTAVIRPRLESVAGQWCHIVELSNIKGPPGETKHIFWMAQDKGMCLMRYQRYAYNKMDKEIEVEQISSADMGGTTVWYPVKARRTYDDAWGMIKDELTVKKFIPNIKVDENTFRFDFPPGTEVFDKIRNISYKATSEQPKSLLEKTPPALNDFSTDFAQANFKGKSILMCFFDMQQRPSRNCLKELAKKIEELKDKDIVVVAIQATKLDEKVLDEWLTENDIPFPARMIRADEEKSRIVWGVRSLPWLILTDKQHIVRAEGFTLEELDEKSKTDR